MKDTIEIFFENVESADRTTARTDEGNIIIETYTCTDPLIGRSAFAYLAQDCSDFPSILRDEENEDDDASPAVLYGYTICIETYEQDGRLRVATISPTYDNGEEIFDYDLYDIICDVDVVLELRKNVFISWSQVEDFITELVQKELSSNSDEITSFGWEYIEKVAPEKTLELLKHDIKEEDLLEEMSKDIITARFNEVLSDSDCKLRV